MRLRAEEGVLSKAMSAYKALMHYERNALVVARQAVSRAVQAYAVAERALETARDEGVYAIYACAEGSL